MCENIIRRCGLLNKITRKKIKCGSCFKEEIVDLDAAIYQHFRQIGGNLYVCKRCGSYGHAKLVFFYGDN